MRNDHRTGKLHCRDLAFVKLLRRNRLCLSVPKVDVQKLLLCNCTFQVQTALVDVRKATFGSSGIDDPSKWGSDKESLLTCIRDSSKTLELFERRKIQYVQF